jgi:hypothetical protein
MIIKHTPPIEYIETDLSKINRDNIKAAVAVNAVPVNQHFKKLSELINPYQKPKLHKSRGTRTISCALKVIGCDFDQ